MARIAWTKRAQEETKDYYSRIAKDSVIVAKKWLHRIRKAVQLLKTFPQIGSQPSELADSPYREQFYGNFRIIYRIEKNRCIIVRVVRGARLLTSDDLES